MFALFLPSPLFVGHFLFCRTFPRGPMSLSFRMRITLLLSLLAASSSSAVAQTLNIPASVQVYAGAGANGPANLVSNAVPFKPGTLSGIWQRPGPRRQHRSAGGGQDVGDMARRRIYSSHSLCNSSRLSQRATRFRSAHRGRPPIAPSSRLHGICPPGFLRCRPRT